VEQSYHLLSLVLSLSLCHPTYLSGSEGVSAGDSNNFCSFDGYYYVTAKFSNTEKA